MYVLMCKGIENKAEEVLEKAGEDGVFSVMGPFETVEEARNFEQHFLVETNVCLKKHFVLGLTHP